MKKINLLKIIIIITFIMNIYILITLNKLSNYMFSLQEQPVNLEEIVLEEIED